MKIKILLIILVLIIGCTQEIIVDRESKLPSDIIKGSPENDVSPPQLNSNEYKKPIPLPSAINTVGAEDSPFITPDGNTLYFFFTPDVRIPVEKQILDGVTGIYFSKKVNGEWQRSERIMLQDTDKLAGDGCEFVKDNIMYFCTVREGYTGIHWFKADYINKKWQDWRNADEELKTSEYETGELHIASNELYFHSARNGGKGGLDIWVSKLDNGIWQSPENVKAVNSADNEGWPAISPDGNELWISKNYGIWRSKKVNGPWQEPEQIISSLAGEASIDNAGNVYFVHHYYKDNKMIEADIYVAYKI